MPGLRPFKLNPSLFTVTTIRFPFGWRKEDTQAAVDGDRVRVRSVEAILIFPREEMNNAFNAFKARVPVAWSPHLYITLVRGVPGTRRLHRRTLEALRLRKCNRTVMRWNTPTVRGMLQQVKRLVVVETEEMFEARKQKDAAHRALRPPLVVTHHSMPAPGSSSQQ